MKKLLLHIMLFLTAIPVNGQLFGKRDLGITQSFISFHPEILNNRSNTGTGISRVTEIDKYLMFKPAWSLNAGLGVGTYRNPDTLFRPFETSNFARLKIGLVLHLPQQYSFTNWSPKRINPYIKAGYNLDVMEKDRYNRPASRLLSSIGTGIGFVYRVSHSVGLQYEFMHHQRITTDYRSYFQHSVGIRINLDTPHLAY